jgi:cyclohexyl-isocyanide hydratase
MNRSLSSTVIGIPIYPNANILDITGLYQVFSNPLIAAKVLLIAASTDPVATVEGLKLVPDTTFDHCPPFDILFVPGGPGQYDMMVDNQYMSFLRARGASAQYVTSVCVGALLLAWAGLLDGCQATTHWDSIPCLELFPNVRVVPGFPRYVIDGNRVTGGGVSAGLDEALQLAALVAGETTAEQIQLLLQYAPVPPFDAGDPSTAPPTVIQSVTQRLQPTQTKRSEQIKQLLGKKAKVKR